MNEKRTTTLEQGHLEKALGLLKQVKEKDGASLQYHNRYKKDLTFILKQLGKEKLVKNNGVISFYLEEQDKKWLFFFEKTNEMSHYWTETYWLDKEKNIIDYGS